MRMTHKPETDGLISVYSLLNSSHRLHFGMVRILLLLAGILCIRQSLSITSRCQAPGNNAVAQITRYLTGQFSTGWAYHARGRSLAVAHPLDADIDITLSVTRLWVNRADGVWLHFTETRDNHVNPFRRRIYHFERHSNGNMIVAHEYTYAGGTPYHAHLKNIQHCEIYFARMDDVTWIGKRRPSACRADHRGAAFVTREIIVNPWSISDHVRGHTANGVKIWGRENPVFYTRVD